MLQNNRVVDADPEGPGQPGAARTRDDEDRREPRPTGSSSIPSARHSRKGVTQDHENRERVAKLLLFRSTRTGDGETIDLEGYVERMADGQENIWFLSGEREDLLAASPALEALREKGEEVLLLTDPVDEFLVAALGEFEGQVVEGRRSRRARRVRG